MEKFRNEQKEDAIQDSELQNLYALTERWKTDLLFYRDDLKFLRHLEDKYFLWIKAETDLEGIRIVGESILKDSRDCDELLQAVDKHLFELAQIIEESLNTDQSIFIERHAELEADIAQFVKNSRENRKQLFKISEYAISANKTTDSKN